MIYLWRSIRLLPLFNGLRIQLPETNEPWWTKELIPDPIVFLIISKWFAMNINAALGRISSWQLDRNIRHTCLRVGVLKWISNPTCLNFQDTYNTGFVSALKVTNWKNYSELSQEVKLMNTVQKLIVFSLYDRCELGYIEAEYFLRMLPIIYWIGIFIHLPSN